MSLGVIILAAGQGTRMRSAYPKVLHQLAGRPLLQHVIDCARSLDAARISVVYGHGGDQVPAAITEPDLVWVEQAEQLGTGHAVEQALPEMRGMDSVLILYGDVPLVSRQTLASLISNNKERALSLLTAVLPDPTGYGRIVRDPSGKVLRIVEHKDASSEELAIGEINTGIMVVKNRSLNRWIDLLENSNSQGEFYLTDIVAMAVSEGVNIGSATADDRYEVLGVNDRVQLAALERHFQQSVAEQLMREGVTLRDPARFDLRGTLRTGRDVEIDINVLLEGGVVLGDRVRIGANTVIRNSRIGTDVQILENCVIEDAEVGSGCRLGPFSRIRPETRLASQVHVGNFVEIKKSDVAEGSKINHLSYIGDSTLGSGVNIGAGTITCNYDGANKHRTVVGDNAFIGSNTALVAPVTVGEDATIGAGSVVAKDAPEGALTVTRSKQLSVKNWRRPKKEK